jgi:hypothetical protein
MGSFESWWGGRLVDLALECHNIEMSRTSGSFWAGVLDLYRDREENTVFSLVVETNLLRDPSLDSKSSSVLLDIGVDCKVNSGVWTSFGSEVVLD